MNAFFKRLLLSLVYVFGSSIYTLWSCGYSLIGTDDANIYYIYMRNFANGDGFVYNIGGERVEGFTSILWTLIGAFAYQISNNPQLILFILNCILVSVLLAKISFLVDKFFQEKPIRNIVYLIFAGLLFLIPGYFDWATLAQMETGLWSFLMGLSVLTVVEMNWHENYKKTAVILSILMLISFWTRPESLLWNLIFIGIYSVNIGLKHQNIKKAILSSLPLLAVYGVGLFSLIAWRLDYFGYPLPNTYYAKVTESRLNNIFHGINYFLKYIIFFNPFIIIILSLFAYWISQNIKLLFSEKNRTITTLVAVSLANFAIPALNGGDFFPFGRFYIALMPIVYILFAILTIQLFKNQLSNISWKSYSVVLLALFSISFMPLKPRPLQIIPDDRFESPMKHEFNIAINGRNIGNGMNKFFKENGYYPSLGVTGAGGIGLTYNGFVNDVLGLNNSEMAHSPKNKSGDFKLKNHASFNKEIFYKQAPELFIMPRIISDTTNFEIWDHKQNVDDEWLSKVLKHVYKDAKFRKLYQPVFIVKKSDGIIVHAYMHTKLRNKLNPEIYKITDIKR